MKNVYLCYLILVGLNSVAGLTIENCWAEYETVKTLELNSTIEYVLIYNNTEVIKYITYKRR